MMKTSMVLILRLYKNIIIILIMNVGTLYKKYIMRKLNN